ncbi:MAG: hypothetical protein M1823_005771 [Watsoniomyces obsoletus]|nr:MAG: hypothetical protein M1823_005771 [Watsoniomyces obsoletus]
MRATFLLLIASACLVAAVPVGPTGDGDGAVEGGQNNGQPNGDTRVRKGPEYIGEPDFTGERMTAPIPYCLAIFVQDLNSTNMLGNVLGNWYVPRL